MSEPTLEIIGKILDLLATYDAAQLKDASESRFASRELRHILFLLARARELTGRQKLRRMAGPETQPGPDELTRLEARVRDALSDSKKLRTTSDIAEIARRSGIPLSLKPKESRSRVVARLLRLIRELPKSERSQKLQALGRELSLTQTEGWFKVIRGD